MSQEHSTIERRSGRQVATGFDLGGGGRLRRRRDPEAGVREGQSDRTVRRREQLYRRLLALADVLAAGLSVFAGVTVLGDELLSPIALLTLPLIILVSKATGLYDRDENLVTKSTLDEAPLLFEVATLYVLMLWLGEAWLVYSPDGAYLAKQQVVGIWGLMFCSMVACRWTARRTVAAVTPPERCLVLGDPRSADRIQEKLDASPRHTVRIIGRAALSDERRKRGGTRLLGELQTLGILFAEHDIQRVIIAPRTTDSEEILHAVRLSKSMGVRVSVLPRLFEVVGSSIDFDDLDGLPLLGVRRGGLGRSSRSIKRATDLVGSFLGILVLAPVLLLVAAAIKLTSSGPVFFRQHRIGRCGKVFSMLKFRSMVQDADGRKADLAHLNEAAGGFFKITDDPRITRIGRFLRRTGLDEAPQLLNVLRGDMSLVGPRPLVPDEDGRIEGHHRSRLDLTPGITGVWQINGSSRVPLEEMVKIDYLYGANWSPWLDVKILLRTVKYALARSGL